MGAPWRCGVLTTYGGIGGIGLGHLPGREHASTPQSGVEAPRLLKRSLSRLHYYCCCCCVVVFCCVHVQLNSARLNSHGVLREAIKTFCECRGHANARNTKQKGPSGGDDPMDIGAFGKGKGKQGKDKHGKGKG